MTAPNSTISGQREITMSLHSVLLVEGNPDDADQMKLELVRELPDLFEVVVAPSMATAIQTLQSVRVDVVVLDLALPDGRGIEVLQWARTVSSRAAVVVISSSDDDQLQRFAYEHGLQDFVRTQEGRVPFLAHHILFAMGRFRSRREREQLATIVGQCPDAIVVTDTAGRVDFVNDAAVELFQKPREELLGSVMRFPIKEPELEEFEIVRSDGKRCAEIHLTSIEWNERPALLATLRDVTDHRRKTHRVRESQKLDAIGLLAGRIAHDFNNILTVILGNAQLAQAEIPKAHSIQALLSENIEAATRGAGLVRQILAFSRTDDSVLAVSPMEKIVRDSIRSMRSTFPANISVVLHIEPDLPPIRANTAQIQQVMVNLCTNAIHAMTPQGGVLEINLTIAPFEELLTFAATELEATRYLRLDVKDSGLGMDRATLERIFEPFFTTKAQENGSGLGLAVVHGIIKSHGGMIAAFSEPGVGSVFRVYLPCVRGDVKVAHERRITYRGNGEQILCIDDDSAIATLLTRLLERLGYRVTTFTNPRAALETYAHDPKKFDAVVTDLSMPGIDGPALVRELHAINPALPIVMMTGYMQPEDLERARDLGVGALLLKPDSLEDLAEVLNKLLP